MERELYFRLWDEGEHKFVVEGSIFLVAGYLAVCVARDEDLNNIIVQQATGVRDREGKRIFEGDIIQRHNQWGAPFKGFIVVSWHGNSTHTGWNIGHGRGSSERRERFKIIGNIKETPHLIPT